MNECHFLGNLVRDPDLRYLDSGVAVCNFTLAVNRVFKKGDDRETKKETAFLDIEAWDSAAELISKHCKKGSPLIVHASAKTETWTTEDGARRSRIKFRANRFQFVPRVKAPEIVTSEPIRKDVDPDDIPF